VTAAGGEGFPVVCNVADEASVNAMVQAVIERYGRVDILVNNAAVLPPGGMTTIRPRHWELAVKVNVHGPFHAIRAVLPTMTAQGSGSIINVSSVTANEVHGPYGATKHSLEGLTVAFARELAGSGVTVNCLKPAGGIDTPGLRFAELEDSVYQNLPPADRYVEAAILLALLTPDQGTGLVCHDTEVIERWASEPLRSQLAALPRG
jgi:NAD(P)-dependent dehydrogenase (short-subunit alcohol dehydrogenase family)